MGKFAQLPQVAFSRKMQPQIESILKLHFPNSKYETNTNIEFDIENAIDGRLGLPSGQKITVQSKIRKNKFLSVDKLKTIPPYPDFTQEFKNGYGTQHESLGEYFKNDAQLYFYGWANELETFVERYVLIDILKLKIFYEKYTMGKLGTLRINSQAGKASFYCISLHNILSNGSAVIGHNFTIPEYGKIQTL